MVTKPTVVSAELASLMYIMPSTELYDNMSEEEFQIVKNEIIGPLAHQFCLILSAVMLQPSQASLLGRVLSTTASMMLDEMKNNKKESVDDIEE